MLEHVWLVALQAAHAFHQLPWVDKMQALLLLGVSWGSVQIATYVSWPMVRRHAGSRLIFRVCSAFVLTMLVFTHAAPLLRHIYELHILHELAIQIGLFLTACIVGVVLYAFRERKTKWTWMGFWKVYACPIMAASSVSSIPFVQPLLRKVHWPALAIAFGG